MLMSSGSASLLAMITRFFSSQMLIVCLLRSSGSVRVRTTRSTTSARSSITVQRACWSVAVSPSAAAPSRCSCSQCLNSGEREAAGDEHEALVRAADRAMLEVDRLDAALAVEHVSGRVELGRFANGRVRGAVRGAVRSRPWLCSAEFTPV